MRISAPPCGLVSRVQRFSIHDGPGIRTTVFLMGCSLSCAWCHNPETRSGKPVPRTIRNRCIACGACMSICPEFHGDCTTFPPKTCRVCGDCVRACPTGARIMSGMESTPDDLMEILRKDVVFYEQSGGGVTFSGGEPMESVTFLRACLEQCTMSGIHTAVDTSGFCPKESFEEIVPCVDLFLYDLKLLDDSQHKRWTGVSVIPILENLTYLTTCAVSMRIRIPLVPGITMTDSNLNSIGGFISSLQSRPPVELLPYHRLGEDKAQRLELTPSRTFVPPGRSETAHAADILRQYDIVVLGDTIP